MGPGDRTNTRCWYSFGQRVGIGPDVVEHHERARSGRCLRPIDGGDALHGRLNGAPLRIGELPEDIV